MSQKPGALPISVLLYFANGGLQTPWIETAAIHQQHEIDQILDARVRLPLARQRVSVEFLSEMFLPRNRRDGRRGDPGESKPVARLDNFGWIALHIAECDIQMESRECTAIEQRVHRVTSSAIGRSIQIHRRLTDVENKEIPQVARCRRLQNLQKRVGTSARIPRNGRAFKTKIDIFRGPSGVQLQFERVCALQNPGRISLGKKPGEEPIESNLAADALQVHILTTGDCGQSIFERAPKRRGGL